MDGGELKARMRELEKARWATAAARKAIQSIQANMMREHRREYDRGNGRDATADLSR